MFLITILVASFSMIAGTVEAIDYVSEGVIAEKLTLYENPRFGLEAVGSDNDTIVYLTITDPIIKEDNFDLSIVVTRFDGVEFPIPNNPIKLCDLLSEEAANASNPLTQFHVSRVFNMEGMTCPIPAVKRRLMPYMFPTKLRLANDIGCGMFTYKTAIELCEGQKAENCMPFIAASTDVRLTGDHCSNTLM